MRKELEEETSYQVTVKVGTLSWRSWKYRGTGGGAGGGGRCFCPSANFFTYEQTGIYDSPKCHDRISGTYLWLKSFEVAGCKVTGCKELEKNNGVLLSETSQSLPKVRLS